MPELPEVETVRQGLAQVMDGATISRVTLNRTDLRWPLPERFAERLSGARVTGLSRRGKYILCALDRPEIMLMHLGMSGRVLLSGVKGAAFYHDHPPAQKHDHVVFDLSAGARVTYNDPRRFGAMDLCAAARIDAHAWLAKMGPEPLGNGFHADALGQRFAGRARPVKAALLDQSVVAGLGNIYVCEALFQARIHPATPVGALSGTQLDALVQAVRAVLRAAIAVGGSSLRDYRQADGELGYFQHAFQVYDREGAQCLGPGCSGVIARVVQSGRSTFYCPQCQR